MDPPDPPRSILEKPAWGLGELLDEATSTGCKDGSGTGPTVGATDLVAVLRQVQLGRLAQGFQGA